MLVSSGILAIGLDGLGAPAVTPLAAGAFASAPCGEDGNSGAVIPDAASVGPAFPGSAAFCCALGSAGDAMSGGMACGADCGTEPGAIA